MSFVALVYLAGYTVPTALLLDDMALLQQLTALIDDIQEASFCVTNATPHPHKTQEASCCATNATPHPHEIQEASCCATNATPHPHEIQEASCCATNATPHPHEIQEASCCATNATPHPHEIQEASCCATNATNATLHPQEILDASRCATNATPHPHKMQEASCCATNATPRHHNMQEASRCATNATPRPHKMQEASCCATNATPHHHGMQEASCCASNATPHPHEIQEVSRCATDATPHPHEIQESSCCTTNATPHPHRQMKPETDQVHSTVEHGFCTAHATCLPGDVACQTECTQCHAKGNANENSSDDVSMRSGEWLNSDVCKVSRHAGYCADKPPEVVFKAERIKYLTFICRIDGVVAEADTSRATPPSSIPDSENVPSAHVSTASDIASTVCPIECHCEANGQVRRHVECNYMSRLIQIKSKGIDDLSNPVMARVCLKLFFLAAGRSLQCLALSWKGLDDATLQFIASHTPNLRTVSLVRRSTIRIPPYMLSTHSRVPLQLLLPTQHVLDRFHKIYPETFHILPYQ